MPRFATSSKDAITADGVRVVRTSTVHCARKDSDFPSEPFSLGPIEGLIAPMIPIAISFVYQHPKATGATSPLSSAGATADTANADRAAVCENFIPAPRIEEAMRHLLSYYPPLSGRLVLHANGDRQIDRLDSGALFVEATCDQSLQELHNARLEEHEAADHGEGKMDAATADKRADKRFRNVLSMFDLPSDSNALFAPFNPAADHVVADPLFSIQHTRFACGGVALGVRVSHALTDAQGFFLFIEHLMELFDQLGSIETASAPSLRQPPQWRAYLSNFRAEATAAELREALAYTPAGLYVDDTPVPAAPTHPTEDAPGAAAPAAAAPPPPPPEVTGRELYFSAAQLEELKRRATPQSGQGWVSTFEAMNAFLWQCLYKARCALWEEDGRSNPEDATTWPVTDFLTSVNLRDRFLVSEELSEPRDVAAAAAAYFPVGCFAPVTTVDPVMLREGPLHTLAAAVHAMLRAPDLTSAEVQRTARWIAAQPDRTRIRNRFHLPGFMISAWNKFDLYAAAACGGVRPILISTPFTCISLLDVLGYILPCPPAFCGAAPDCCQEDGCESDGSVLATDGVIVYLAADAKLWPALCADSLLGPHVH